MKNTIETLENIIENKIYTAKRIAFIEIVNNLIGKIRNSNEYKSARSYIFAENGEVKTECSTDTAEYGYNIKLTHSADSEQADVEAYLASIGVTKDDIKALGFVKVVKGSDRVTLKKQK